MEMTELQHSLSEARGEADGARETAENAVTSLQEAQATHKRVPFHHAMSHENSGEPHFSAFLSEMTTRMAHHAGCRGTQRDD